MNIALLSIMPVHGRVLDIGCGRGAWSAHLRRHGADRLIGIEPSEPACAIASTRYDVVVGSPVENVTLYELGGETFDLIIAADLLEHLVDPWAQLSRWREWSAPDGRLAISVPNLRDLKVMSNLVFRGAFNYSDSGGLMDRTHLRWFTERTLVEDLRAAGWHPEVCSGSFGPIRSGINRMTGQCFQSLLAHQLHVIARS